MKQNIHNIERIVRIVIGVGLITQAFWGIQSLWFLLGLFPIVTGITGWCPPYELLGINTCANKECIPKGVKR